MVDDDEDDGEDDGEDDEEDDGEDDGEDDEGGWAALTILRGATQPHTRAFPLPFAPDTPDLDDGTICEVAASASGINEFPTRSSSIYRDSCES